VKAPSWLYWPAGLPCPWNRGTVDAVACRESMGHTSPAVALRYQHVMAGRDQAIAAALDELVQAAANLPPQRPTEPPSGTLVARNRRAKSEGPGRHAARRG
jgi:hypothetical protein